MRVKVDLTGQRFGRLLVLSEAGRMYGHVAYRCQCDCSEQKIAAAHNLKKGRNRSCGCLNREQARRNGTRRRNNLVGRQFGRLTVCALVGSNSHRRALWICECVCGERVIVSTNNLQHGTRSCGATDETRQLHARVASLEAECADLRNELFEVE
jgi:hypothetical protein